MLNLIKCHLLMYKYLIIASILLFNISFAADTSLQLQGHGLNGSGTECDAQATYSTQWYYGSQNSNHFLSAYYSGLYLNPGYQAKITITVNVGSWSNLHVYVLDDSINLSGVSNYSRMSEIKGKCFYSMEKKEFTIKRNLNGMWNFGDGAVYIGSGQYINPQTSTINYNKNWIQFFFVCDSYGGKTNIPVISGTIRAVTTKIGGTFPTTTLNLSSTEMNFTSEASQGVIQVTSDTSWTATSSASWIMVRMSTGNNNGSILYSVAANTSSSSRCGTITVSTPEGSQRIQTITQMGEHCLRHSQSLRHQIVCNYL